MKVKLLFALILLDSIIKVKAQSYSYAIIQNSEYNYSVAVVPDYTSDVANPPNMESFGFTIMLPDPDGTVPFKLDNITFHFLTMDSAIEFNSNQLDIADPGEDRSATLVTSTSGVDYLPNHVAGDVIPIVTFDISGAPTTGAISILDNNSALATDPGAMNVFDSYFIIDETGGFTPSNLYGGQTAPFNHELNGATLSLGSEVFESVSVYPNPVKEVININGLETKLTTVELYDLNGKLLLGQNQSLEEGVNVENLHTGIYILHLKTNTATKTIKIVKQ